MLLIFAQFSSAVYNVDNMAVSDKSHYLRGQLEGDALDTIDGLPFTADNYQPAIDLDTERF